MSDVAGTIGPGTDDVVRDWVATQRWYAAKGATPQLRVIAAVTAAVDDVRIVTRFVIDDAPAVPVLYQVPLTERSAPLDEIEHALVGTDGTTWLYDAPHDPAYARWLLATMDTGGAVASDDHARIDGTRFAPAGTPTTATVLRGEQSNTSIICDVDGGVVPRVIVKVFRVLHHGENPDVTTQAALSSVGSSRVPRSFGALTGTWPDPGRAEGVAVGHVAFAQEFLPGLEDAWREALRIAAAGTSFAGPARSLGAALAEVHDALARTLPTADADERAVAEAVATMRERLVVASREVPAVAEHAERIGRVYDRLQGLVWPVMQRVHGDLHLGQVLDGRERGWVLLDFEGEPLRPMPERSRPDSPLRDVAGMLRSFDYVAGSLVRQDPPVDTGGWAHEAREAFLAGYESTSGRDLHAQRALVDAFEIDKAVYEAVYEARNRPAWIDIPVSAVARLAARSAG